jgi:hypothetical protein
VGGEAGPQALKKRSACHGATSQCKREAVLNCCKNNVPRQTNPATTSDKIVTGKHTRSSAHAAYFSTFAVAYISTFASAINPVKAQELHEPTKVCLHQDHLPSPPKRWSELDPHPFGNCFKLAEQAKFDDILRKGCFRPEAHKESITKGEILPLM